MLNLMNLIRRPLGRITVDERTGDVCTPGCRAVARRERDVQRALHLHGPR